jgi:hypothetical protein
MKPPRRTSIEISAIPTRAIVSPGVPQGVQDHLDRINKTLSNISFGSSMPSAPAVGQSKRVIDPESNFEGDKFIVTSPAASNTEFAISHNLGRIPNGFLFLGGTNQGVVYRSITPWTKTQAFFKETQGSNVVTILIV